MSILFVDESKAKGYTMVAALVVPGDATSLRRDVRSLVLPGQRRIHFTKEQPERKRLILSRLTAFGAQAQVFHCAAKSQLLGREACLTGIVAHAAEHAHTKIVIERDESIEKADRQILFREVRRHGLGDILSYAHEVPHQEPLLWVADAIAWSYTKAENGRNAPTRSSRGLPSCRHESAKLGSPTVRKAAELTSHRYCSAQHHSSSVMSWRPAHPRANFRPRYLGFPGGTLRFGRLNQPKVHSAHSSLHAQSSPVALSFPGTCLAPNTPKTQLNHSWETGDDRVHSKEAKRLLPSPH